MYFIYKLLPICLQNLVCSLYGFLESKKRFSPKFFEFLNELKKSQYFTDYEIEKLKRERLSKALLNAKNSNLYPELDEYSLKELDERPEGILANLPVMSKDLLISKTQSLNAGSNEVLMSTSGTTGKALTIIKDKESIAMQWAVWFRHRSRYGISLGDISVNFTGKPLVPVGQKSPPFWRYNAVQKQYLISMQKINEKNIVQIVNFLNSVKPAFYSGYPSIIAELSRLALHANLTLTNASKPK